jgi:hypothetical protein
MVELAKVGRSEGGACDVCVSSSSRPTPAESRCIDRFIPVRVCVCLVWGMRAPCFACRARGEPAIARPIATRGGGGGVGCDWRVVGFARSKYFIHSFGGGLPDVHARAAAPLSRIHTRQPCSHTHPIIDRCRWAGWRWLPGVSSTFPSETFRRRIPRRTHDRHPITTRNHTSTSRWTTQP